MEINEDIFTCILSYISDPKTLHSVLNALSTSHLLFPSALARFWELPVYLDSYDPQVASLSQNILDFLLQENLGYPLVESVRHLVVAVEHKPLRRPAPGKRHRITHDIPAEATALHKRLAELLNRAVNVESLDYHSFPSGLGLQSEHVPSLSYLVRLRSIAIDCAVTSRDRDIPSDAGPGNLSAKFDAEVWNLQPFLSRVGKEITSLDLRHVNQTMYTALRQKAEVFRSYHNLKHLRMDITEGVWDWTGHGEPVMGPGPAFTFPLLGFPALKRFELIVWDNTLTNSARGPLNLVHCNILTSLSIDVRESNSWMAFEPIKLFNALSPRDFPALCLLEVKDRVRNTAKHYWQPWDDKLGAWNREGRSYTGLVPRFLGAMDAGALPNLTSLWLDERVLLPPNYRISVQVLLAGAPLLPPRPSSPTLWPPPPSEEPINIEAWAESLRPPFAQLASLRVGFGAIDHLDAAVILDLCDPQKLTQFGFEWKWTEYYREEYFTDDPIDLRLLDQLRRFPKLTDVHILFPRPETKLSGLPDPDIDAVTLHDIASIFGCNSAICRVGIGNSLVWERHPSVPSEIILVSDASVPSNPAVPKFYHAGYLARDPSGDIWDNAVPPRPDRKAEMEQLTNLLQRIVK
ncbi:hypothetical protein B0H16DRAFT_1560271 [Mycena metata]|uniref:Uncharacterized protein n=1 Tax=Mycena metata TaxID=1033252 RepID=A0AAD7N3L5_9AGAR|nr:hypothetical protein B0H16DRAFT_1560271 [Mycena metata]